MIGVAAALTLGRESEAVSLLELQRSLALAAEPALSAGERAIVARLRDLVAQLRVPALVEEGRGVLLGRQRALEHELRRERRGTTARADVKPARPAWRVDDASELRVDMQIVATRAVAILTDGNGSDAVDLGTKADLMWAIDRAQMAIDATALDRVSVDADRLANALRRSLESLLTRLDRADRAVVITDPSLGRIPWSLLTATPVTLAASHHQFNASAAGGFPPIGRVGIVVGPWLAKASDEAHSIAQHHRHAVVLEGSRIDLGAVRELLDDADLVHFAAHGRFRADNPLMSHLELGDSPVTFYDLFQQRTLPRRMVFSACHLGQQTASAALGLTGLLFDRGCQAFIAAGGPTNDTATASLMSRVHRDLASGERAPMAVALRRAQAELLGAPSLSNFYAFGSA